MGIVYCATNIQNGKSYIGQTINTLERRKRSGYHGCLKFERAIQKYGTEGFLWRVLFESETTDELDERECFWIKAYNSIEEGYNLSPGGQPKLGRMLLEETRKRMSLAHIGVKKSPEHIQHVIDSRRKYFRPVYCAELNKTYPTITEAAKEHTLFHNNIIKCCQGQRHTAGGLHWQYVN